MAALQAYKLATCACSPSSYRPRWMTHPCTICTCNFFSWLDFARGDQVVPYTSSCISGIQWVLHSSRVNCTPQFCAFCQVLVERQLCQTIRQIQQIGCKMGILFWSRSSLVIRIFASIKGTILPSQYLSAPIMLELCILWIHHPQPFCK